MLCEVYGGCAGYERKQPELHSNFEFYQESFLFKLFHMFRRRHCGRPLRIVFPKKVPIISPKME